VEGVRVGKEAVLGANVVLTGSSKIIDVTQSIPVEYKGYVPPSFGCHSRFIAQEICSW
jgi:Tetrahydrodipicolinate N-succinyltransferase